MDNLYIQEIRQRYHSSMTYQEYLDTYDKPPPKPHLRPKESPQILDPLSLEPPKGPKIQQQKLTVYSPEDVIFEESETDEKFRPANHIPCLKALKEYVFKKQSQEYQNKKLEREPGFFRIQIFIVKEEQSVMIQIFHIIIFFQHFLVIMILVYI